MYGVEAVLLLSMPVPTWMVWGLLAVVTGLVALACLIGTGSAVWAKAEPGLAQRREQRRSRDAWVQFWEDLAQRSVR
ncbi:MAG: hypothetical protein HY680_10370 [Chloroflexi bacterium]|nr:hypothetical protein [Chloroflexota bacterium]